MCVALLVIGELFSLSWCPVAPRRAVTTHFYKGMTTPVSTGKIGCCTVGAHAVCERPERESSCLNLNLN
jgi:hypothetical protein